MIIEPCKKNRNGKRQFIRRLGNGNTNFYRRNCDDIKQRNKKCTHRNCPWKPRSMYGNTIDRKLLDNQTPSNYASAIIKYYGLENINLIFFKINRKSKTTNRRKKKSKTFKNR